MEKGPELHLTPPELLPHTAAGLIPEAALPERLDALPGWRLEKGLHPRCISRTWQTPDFASSAILATRIGELADACGHHPDISYGWGYLRVSWRSHDLGGIHENDLLLAHATDRLLTHAP